MQESNTYKFQISKNLIICRLLEFLLIINLLFALFPAWHISPLWNFIPTDSYFSIWISLAKKITIIISLFIILFEKKYYSKRLFIAICVVFIGVSLSLLFNDFYIETSYIVLFAPTEYIVLFIISKKYKFSKKLTSLIIYIMAIWSILPLVLLILFPGTIGINMFISLNGGFNTFRGFALHRNFYGFYTGLTVLLFMMSSANKSIKITVIITCFLGLILCGSRSSQLCTIVSMVILMVLKNKKLIYIIIPIGVSCLAIFSYFSQTLELRSSNYGDNDDRVEILKGFGKMISERPIIGYGKMTQYYPIASPDEFPAHNIIAQVWADYGILTLLSFLILLLLAYQKSDKTFKVLFSYLLLISLSQPYFYVSLAWTFMVIIILLGNCASFNDRRNNSKSHSNKFKNNNYITRLYEECNYSKS